MREIIGALFFFAVLSLSTSVLLSFAASRAPTAQARKSYAALKSQANALTFIFLSGLILSQSLIIAYNFTNSTSQDIGFPKMGTPTGFAALDAGSALSPENGTGAPGALNESSAGPLSDLLAGNATALETEPTVAANEATELLPQPQNATEAGEYQNSTANQTAPSNETAAPDIFANITGNGTANDTSLVFENVTIPDVPFGNGTGEENATAPDIPANDTENITFPVPAPSLSLIINISNSAVRGYPLSLFVEILNSGDLAANNAAISLELPEGVSLISGDMNVGTIPAGASVSREFTLQASFGASLGANDLRVRVTYE